MDTIKGDSKLNAQYWQDRYQQGQTGWDIGYASTPIKSYFAQYAHKDAKVLIPGAGNSYEAEHLWQQGFQNTFVLDFAEAPLQHLSKRLPEFPEEQLLHVDFFAHKPEPTPYDLIVEQTFFCALDPKLRERYAQKMHSLLKPGGKLIGLLFNVPLNSEKPPFGGDKQEYEAYFDPYFKIRTMDLAYNSIPPRKDSELFVILEKPS